MCAPLPTPPTPTPPASEELPAPPNWLVTALLRLRETHANDIFEATMRRFAIDAETGQRMSVAQAQVTNKEVKWKWTRASDATTAPENYTLPVRSRLSIPSWFISGTGATENASGRGPRPEPRQGLGPRWGARKQMPGLHAAFSFVFPSHVGILLIGDDRARFFLHCFFSFSFFLIFVSSSPGDGREVQGKG